jgi:protein gp37
MGCGGCELFPSPEKILTEIDNALSAYCREASGQSRKLFRILIDDVYNQIASPLPGHSRAVSSTNIWHLRQRFLDVTRSEYGREAAEKAELVLNQAVTCYAARLHLNKARSILNPTRGANPGYAPTFESVTRYRGRVWEMALSRDLRGIPDPEKPWLDGCSRLIFVSDMGDAFSRESDFAFLEEEVIAPILSAEGQRHFWLWLTKRPERMARFGDRIGGFPENVCAMTTITGPDKLGRIDELRQVPASVRGLSIEPLRDRIPPERLDLKGISWMILGGESGRYDAVRPFDLSWARELREVCHHRGVAFFLKQLGRRPFESGNELKLRDSHGGDWSEWPADLRVREMPEAFGLKDQ